MAADQATLLHEAIEDDDIEAIRSLLVNGSDPNAPNRLGRRPLAVTSDKDVMGLLLAHGADPNLADSIGYAALDIAVRSETPDEVIELLMNAGANPNATDPIGFSAFTYACKQADIATIRAMIRCGADVEKVDSNGVSPLAASARRPEIQELLHASGATKLNPIGGSRRGVAAGGTMPLRPRFSDR